MPDNNTSENKKQWMTVGIVVVIVVIALGVVFFFLGKVVGKAQYVEDVNTIGIQTPGTYVTEMEIFPLPIKAKITAGATSFGFVLSITGNLATTCATFDSQNTHSTVFSHLHSLIDSSLIVFEEISCESVTDGAGADIGIKITGLLSGLCGVDGTSSCPAGDANGELEVAVLSLQAGTPGAIVFEFTDPSVVSVILGLDTSELALPVSGTTTLNVVAAVVDVDGDGYSTLASGGDDCDDGDATRFPGNPELCDGKDNDCDSATADDANQPEVDASNQQGICTGAKKVCNAGAMVNPDYTALLGYSTDESSCNGIDNNCDGRKDENYAPDATCFLQGVCAVSNVASVCNVGGAVTACSTGTPGTESCSGGQDEDCDGLVDCDDTADCPSTPSACEIPVCGDGTKQSTEGCEDSNVNNNDGCSSTCTLEDLDNDGFTALDVSNAIFDCDDRPSGADGTDGNADDGENINPDKSELCNAIDDDCDTATTDGIDEPEQEAFLHVGVCENAKKVCSAGAMIDPDYTNIDYEATTESSCSDSLDNDCDGDTDSLDLDCINAELTPDEGLDTLLGRMLFTAKVGRKIKEVTS